MEFNDPIRSHNFANLAPSSEPLIGGRPVPEQPPSRLEKLKEQYAGELEVAKECGKQVYATYLVAWVVGFNPFAAAAYSTVVFIIGKLAERRFERRYHEKWQKLHDREKDNSKYWIGVIAATDVLFLRYGLVPQYALTLLGIEKLGYFLKKVGEELSEEIQYVKRNEGRFRPGFTWGTSSETWKKFITRNFVKLIVSVPLSYSIAKVAGMNPVAAATYVVAVFVLEQFSELAFRQFKGRAIIAWSASLIDFGLSAVVVRNAFSITLPLTAAYYGIKVVAGKVASSVVKYFSL